MDLRSLDADLVISAAILLHQREQDQGAGITHISGTQKALWAFYRQQKARETARVSKMAYLNAFILRCSVKVSELVKEAELAPNREVLDNLVRQVGNLQDVVELAQEQLEILNG